MPVQLGLSYCLEWRQHGDVCHMYLVGRHVTVARAKANAGHSNPRLQLKATLLNALLSFLHLGGNEMLNKDFKVLYKNKNKLKE
jgi:hypothetical protein